MAIATYPGSIVSFGARTLARYLTVLLPAVLVLGAEIVRHEWLHDVLPVMLGNVVTGAIALGISLLIFVPLYRRLDSTDARVRRLEIEHAVRDERERIARELHEGISQALFFLNVEAGTLERSLGDPTQPETALRTVREIAQAVQDTASRVRDTIFDLRTARQPDQPFAAWLRAYAQQWSDIHNVAVTLEEVGPPLALPVERELHVMALIREILHNVAKHAQARTVTITVTRSKAGLAVAVADDGRGLPDPVPGPAQGRYGLATLREHAAAAGGTVAVSQVPGGGTAIVLSLHGLGERT
ncbi:MAG TPA: histidine kinase [bacterium]|nr:histidine kinase [bacterium]